MEAAAANLTPVVLELGGKDPFVVCEDTDIDGVVQTACRGVWQNMGQNCAGPERFFVYEGCYEEFTDKVVKIVSQMRQGTARAAQFHSIPFNPIQFHSPKLVFQRSLKQ